MAEAYGKLCFCVHLQDNIQASSDVHVGLHAAQHLVISHICRGKVM